MKKYDMAKYSVSELLLMHSSISEELRNRDILRSSNNPVADYTEYIVAKALSLILTTKSTAGFDAKSKKGKRYEIKGRRLTRYNKPTRFSAIRNIDKREFDYFVGVLFSEDFIVEKACCIPYSNIKKYAIYQKHVNGWIVKITDGLWKNKGVKDITNMVKFAQNGV